jgi:plasmid stabilization system protein ParE
MASSLMRISSAKSPNSTYREVIVRPFRVIYRYERELDNVVIVNIIHGRQRLPSFG